MRDRHVRGAAAVTSPNGRRYSVASWLQPIPIDDVLLKQDGVPMSERGARHDLRRTTVEQAMRPAESPVESDGPTREARVVDRANPDTVIGALSLEDISATVNRTWVRVQWHSPIGAQA